MKTSADGRARIRKREGERLTAYRDSKGIWTIGVGHTGLVDGTAVHSGMVITSQQSDELLAADLVVAERAVNLSLPHDIKQNQFDALVSVTFNIGASGYKTSTMARNLRSGDIAGTGKAILLWNKPPEIKGRRATEYNQFFEGTAALPKPVTENPVAPSNVHTEHVENVSFWTKLIQFIIFVFKGKQ